MKQGITKIPEYSVWRMMKQRCNNPRHKDYHRYGGRGIMVCERWTVSFVAFLADVGSRPAGTTLDRKDNDGDYTPDNCRWATNHQQHRNKSTNRLVPLAGERVTTTEASELTGISRETIASRLRRGWSPEKAASTPARPYQRRS